MAQEIEKFVKKFKELKNVGLRAFLWVESQAGEAFVTLQVHLPADHSQEQPHRPGHGHDEPHRKEPHLHHYPRRQQPMRPGPARLRRHEARAKARAAKLAADVQAATADKAVISSQNPVKFSAVQADIDKTAAQVDATPVLKAAVKAVEPSEEESVPTNLKTHHPEEVEMKSPIPLYVWHNKRPPKTPRRKYHRGIVRPNSEQFNPIHALVSELNHRALQLSLSPPSPPTSSPSARLRSASPSPSDHPSSPPFASPVSAPSSPSSARDLPATDGTVRTTVKQLARRGGPWDVLGPEFYLMSDSEDEEYEAELSSHLSSLLNSSLSSPPPHTRRVELPSQEEIANMSYEDLLRFAGGYEKDILEELD